MAISLTITVMAEPFAICRLPEDASLPGWIESPNEFLSITRTRDELSIVCAETVVPDNVTCERNWRLLKVAGPLDFELTGILASLVTPLAKAGISVFSVSTFDTDYLLVKSDRLDETIRLLDSFITINYE